MNRLTVTIELSDVVDFSEDNFSKLIDSIYDVFFPFGIQPSMIDDVNIFHEKKKRYRST